MVSPHPLPSSSPLVGAPVVLPRPAQLAALGAVLCLYRPALGDPAAGWRQAFTAATQRVLDSDGVHESLWFFDAQGQPCWRLCLLPDSDFLQWDRLLARLPELTAERLPDGVGERLWRRLAGRVRGDTWRATAVRLRQTQDRAQSLSLDPVGVSPLGAEISARIARLEGIDGHVAIDDCCCARAATPHATGEPFTPNPSLLRLRR
ncbi:hypothetical protein [Xanthomonas maliensis]|uniref:hypothetical protein n=1 Tax=Xanthomonas maliensis TaxID=1321368 RepID=UPI0003A4668F|nr:Hemin transport protein [Xanthomonas maliensis]